VNGSLTGTTGNVTVNSGGTFAVQNGSISAILAGTGNLAKSTGGIVMLSGQNTYTGGTAISGGTLALGANNVLADLGNVTITGGEFALGDFSDTVNVVTLTSGNLTGNLGILTGSVYNVANGNVSAILGGSANLTKTTSGTVTLSGQNTYTGGTVILGGTLALGASGALAATGNITVNGGTFDVNSNNNILGNLTLANGSVTGSTGNVTVNTGGSFSVQNGSVSAILAGTAGLIKNTSGTVTLSGQNTYTGGTTIANGILTLGANATLLASGNLAVTGGTFDVNSLNNVLGNVTLVNGSLTGTTGNVTVNSGGTFAVQNGSISAILAGTGNLAKSTGGIVMLSGQNTYTGGTAISGGTLALGANNVLADLGNVTITGGEFALGDFSDTVNVVTLTSGNLTGNRGILTGSAYSVASGNISAILGGSANLTKTTSGTVTLAGQNTYTGGTVILGGTLALGASGALAATGFVTVNGGTFDVNSNNNVLGNLTLANGSLTGSTGNVTVNNGGTFVVQNGTISAILAGTGSLTKNTSGTVTLSGQNTYTGGTSVSSGTLALGANNVLADSGNLTLTGGEFALGDFSDIVNVVTLTGGNLTGNLGVLNGSAYSLAGGNVSAILDGTAALNKNTGSVVTLTAANTYSGGTTVNGGTLALAGNGTLGNTANALAINNGGELALGSTNQSTGTVTLGNGTISGTGTLTGAFYSVQTGTVSAVLGGTANLTKTTNGTVTLSNNNSFSGGVSVQAGTLAITNHGALGTGSSAILLGTASTLGTLAFTGANNDTVNRDLTVAGIGGGDILNNTGFELTLGGTLSNNGNTLRLSGGPILVTGNIVGALAGSNLVVDANYAELDGNNSYNGTTSVVNGGVLGNAITNALPLTTVLTLGDLANSSGVYDLVGFNQSIAGLADAGTGSRLVTDGALANSTLTITGSGSFGGIIQDGNGSVALVKSTGGTEVLSGANTYTGGTFITGGTLALGANNSLATAGNVTVNGGEFALGNFSETVNILSLTAGNLTGNAGILSGNAFNLSSGNVSASLGGSGGLTKSTSGTVNLTGNDSYSGNTTVNAGTLVLGNSTAVVGTAPTISGGNIVVNAGAIFDTYSNHLSAPVIVNGGIVLTENGSVIGGSTGVTVNSGGTLLGIGSVTASLTVNAGGVLQPGFGTGTGASLKISGLLTLASNAVITLNTSANLTNNYLSLLTSGVTDFGGAAVKIDLVGSTGGAVINPGFYPLITSVGGLANITNFVWDNRPAQGYASSGFVILGGNLDLHVISSSQPNQWSLSTGGSWANPAFWSYNGAGESLPPNGVGPNVVVTFANGTLNAPSTITLDGDRTVGGLQFTSTVGYTIAAGSGGNLTLDNGSGTIAALLVTLGSHAINVPVILTANSTVSANIASGATLAIGGAVSGANGITKIGGGLLSLSGNESYSGGLTINNGTVLLSGSSNTPGNITLNSTATLDLNSAAALGTGQVVINGGALDNTSGSAKSLPGANLFALNNDFSFLGTNDLSVGTGALTMSQSVTLTVVAGNLTLTGAVLDGTAGLSTFTKAGNGTLTLTGASNVSTIEITGGTMILAGGNSRLAAGVTLNLGDGGNGSGVLVLGNVSTPSSQTINSLNVLGTGPANAIVGGSGAVSNLTINLLANGTTDFYSGLLGNGVNYAATAANEIALSKVGNGTLVLTGNNTYLGNTTISRGAIRINSDNNLGVPTGAVILGNTSANGTLELAANNSTTTNRPITINGTGSNLTVDANSTLTLGVNATLTTTLTTDNLNKAGVGTLVLAASAPYTYTSATNILAGTLQQNLANLLPSNTALNITANATFAMNGLNATIGSLAGAGNVAMSAISGNGSLTVGGNNASTTYTGVISGNGSNFTTDANLVKVGTGTLTLGGADTFTGATTISAGTLVVNNSLALQNSLVNDNTTSGALVFNPGITNATFGELSGNKNLALTNSGSVAVALSVGKNGADATYSGVLSGANSSLIKVGAGNFSLTNTNIYTGATTISAGTLTLTNATPGLSAGIVDNGTLVFNQTANSTYGSIISGTGAVTQNANTSLTLSVDNTYTGLTSINNGTLTFTGNINSLTGNIVDATSLVLNQTVANTISGSITGAGNLTQAGTSTLTLSNNNPFTGTTTIAAGTLAVNNSLALQNSTVIYNTTGGNLVFSSGVTNATFGELSGNKSLSLINAGSSSVALSVGKNGGNATYSGVLSGNGSSLTKLGAGNLTLTNANTYTGATTIAAGTLTVTNPAFATTSAITNNGALVFNQTGDSTYAGVISGAGTLTQNANTTLNLGGNNTYSGLTTINFGTINFLGNTTLVTGNLVNNGNLLFTQNFNSTYLGLISGAGDVYKYGTGALTLNGASPSTGIFHVKAGTLIFTSDPTVENDADVVITANANITQSSIISGTGNLTSNGTATLTFINEMTYTGFTNITAGTTQLGDGTTNGILDSGNIFDNANLTFAINATTETYAGNISGTGNLAILSGLLVLNNAESYTGTTTITGGTLQLGDGSLNGMVASNGILDNADLAYNGNATAQTFSGPISGTGNFTMRAGSLTLNAPNTFSGNTTLTGGTLVLTSSLALQNSILVYDHDGGALDLSALTTNATLGGLSGAQDLALPTGFALTFANPVGATTATYSGNLSGSGVSLTMNGADTQTLAGTNTFDGGTTVNNGTLALGATNTLLSTAAVTVNGGTLSITTFDETVGNLTLTAGNLTGTSGTLSTTAATFNLQSGNVSAILGGSASLTKSTSGTVVLSANNTFTGNTAISGGTLQLGDGTINGLVASGNIVNDGTLAFNGNSTPVTYSGNLSGVGNVNVVNGTLALNQDNTFSGPTNITGGTMVINSSLALQFSDVNLSSGNLVFGPNVTAATFAELSGSQNVVLSNTNGTPQAVAVSEGGGNGDSVFSGDLSGLGSLIKLGSGTLTLSSSNLSYAGSTTINAGTLTSTGSTNTFAGGVSIGASGTFNLAPLGAAPNIAGNVANSGTFNYHGFDSTTTYAGNISGAGTTNYLGSTGVALSEGTTGRAGNITSASSSGDILILSGVNANSGGTVSVTTGGVVVSGQVQGTVHIGSGSYLGGGGSINSDVTVSGGVLAPGLAETMTYANIGNNSHGTAANLDTLTIDGNLAWTPSATAANVFHLSGTDNTSDRINVVGNVTYGGTGLQSIAFDFQDTGFFDGTDPETYTLLTASNDLSNLGFSLNQLHAENVWDGGRGTVGSYFMFANGGTTLEFVVVPEPSTWSLLMGAAVLLLAWRRPRQIRA